ncbi:MAG TPA: hypothetical protein PLD47_03810 [Aggregatilineales bacterium]|nr:hypothetical protein [Anaerolineales bacterium]HRE46827.1 hypothetical protein [Aggregatilineales bacterium]
MKILTISDNVMGAMEHGDNLLRNYGSAAAIVSCGDMPASYLDYITSVLNVPLLFVRGNHDTQYTADHPGGENLHRRLVRFKGVSFVGLEGCIRYNRDPIQYTNKQMLTFVVKLLPSVMLYRLIRRRRLDVLVTHSPMRGVHDLDDHAHKGFRGLRLAVRWFQPRYMLHGHIDTQDSRRPTHTRVYNTEVINVNPVKFLDLSLE